jgi:hypothetical protein
LETCVFWGEKRKKEDVMIEQRERKWFVERRDKKPPMLYERRGRAYVTRIPSQNQGDSHTIEKDFNLDIIKLYLDSSLFSEYHNIDNKKTKASHSQRL